MGISKKTVGLIMGGALVGGAVYLLNKYRKETQEDYTGILNRMFNQYGLGDTGCCSCDGCCLGHCGVGLSNMANEDISNQETPEQTPAQTHQAPEQTPEQTTQTNENADRERTDDADERIDRFINAVHEVLKAFGTETKK